MNELKQFLLRLATSEGEVDEWCSLDDIDMQIYRDDETPLSIAFYETHRDYNGFVSTNDTPFRLLEITE